MNEEVKNALTELLRAAEAMSSDIGDSVEEMLREGLENPIPVEEVRALLTRIVEVVRAGAVRRGDTGTVELLDRDAEAFIAQTERIRARLWENTGADAPSADSADPGANSGPSATGQARLQLRSYDGIKPGPVRPAPVFHERSVAVLEGFVRTRDIQLWDKNVRLDIHLNQFRGQHGRDPDADELMAIMNGDMLLPGIEDQNQFKIHDLAKSVAVNGVRKPPILDLDGTLLDGNRRVTACYHILADDSGEFSVEEKQRAEWLKVWQLTEHATDQDREAVIVSLNFEPDYKEDWPKYVKAQKVYEEWETRLALEPRDPGRARVTAIKREIARKFALSTNEVSRYISMVGLAREFEDYQVVERSKDQFAAKHRASDKFEYFDELNKGKGAGGVYWSLNQDESFKHLVFDLLYDGKFQSWQKIRDLKYVYENDDAIDLLRKARDESDREAGQEEVNSAIDLARVSRAERRQTGANTRIKVFAEWFLGLPVKAFNPSEPGSVKRENLERLRNVLAHVEVYLQTDSAEDAQSDAA
ncbi:MAG: hypothetical protein OXH99_08040 [Bryobacterales bacterium]|nr:hypothetical protein [Bryobacterales bacterium]